MCLKSEIKLCLDSERKDIRFSLKLRHRLGLSFFVNSVLITKIRHFFGISPVLLHEVTTSQTNAKKIKSEQIFQ
jgi:hypothetical protein